MESTIQDEDDAIKRALFNYFISLSDDVTADSLRRQKHVVTTLNSTLEKSLEAGATFNQLVDVMRNKGLEIGSDTLQTLYFQDQLKNFKSELLKKIFHIFELVGKRHLEFQHKLEERIQKVEHQNKSILAQLAQLQAALPVAANNGTPTPPSTAAMDTLPPTDVAVETASAPVAAPSEVTDYDLKRILNNVIGSQNIPSK